MGNRRRMMGDITKVKYVESNLNSILRTGINSANDVRLLLDCQFIKEKNDDGGNSIAGCIDGQPGAHYYYHITLYGSSIYFGSGSGERSYHTSDRLSRMTIDYYNNGNVLINGNTVISGLDTVYANKEIYLFARNLSGQYAYSVARLYSCKIYKAGTLVRDFIPAVDNNGTGFLLDKVHNKSYYANLTVGYK